MNPVEARWVHTRDALQAEIMEHPRISCHVPGWQPVDLAMGLQWLQSTIYEGFQVAYRVSPDGDGTMVLFKRWEYGELEPPWPNV